MANDVPSVSVPMNNARFGRLLSKEEMAELARMQRHYDAQARASAAGLPPPTLDYDGNPLTVMKAWDERKAAERRAAREELLSGRGGQGDVDTHLNNAAMMGLAATAAGSSLPAAVVSALPLPVQAAAEYRDGGVDGLLNSQVVPQTVLMAAPFVRGAMTQIGPLGKAIGHEVSGNLRHLIGKSPSVILPVGPRGMERLSGGLNSSSRKIANAILDIEATRSKAPKDVHMYTAAPKLSAQGRATLRKDDTVVDRIYSTIKNKLRTRHLPPEDARQGIPVDLLLARRDAQATALRTAYPNLTRNTRVYHIDDPNSRTLGDAINDPVQPKILLNRSVLEGHPAPSSVFSHEFKHVLEQAEPFSKSNYGTVYYRWAQPKVDPAVELAVRQQRLNMLRENPQRVAAITEDERYKTQVHENTARAVGLMERLGLRSYADLLKKLSPTMEIDPVTGRRSINLPDSPSFPVYIDPEALQIKVKNRTLMTPRDQMDAKGGDTRADAKGGTAAETFDTPIPEELRARYDAWYAQLPKNLQYTGDYDLQGAWLERLGRPDKYEAAQNGHLDDYGKKPNHITFSTGSKWHDPKVPERAGGEWKQAEDGSWDFYPGTGNKASDDELKAYFDRYEKGNRVHRREVRQDAKGGDTPDPETEASEPPVSEPAPQDQGGPRIVINPTTFKNKKDALCVAFNEGFRLWMEANDFQPQSEPTDRQRRFFSDTAYADDELQLRRTILARVATFDTSVKDPTDDQLSETAQFLDGVLESGWCKNEWEQDCVSRLSEAVKAAIGAEPVEPREGPLEPAQAEPLVPAGGEEVQALQSGGSTDDEDEDRFALQNSGQSDKVDQVEDKDLASREAGQAESAGMQPEAQEQAQEPAADQGAATAQAPAADAPQAGQGLLHDALTGNLVTPEQAGKAKDGIFVDLGPADYGAGTLPGGGSIDNQVNEMHKQVLSVFGLNNAAQSDDPASNKNGRAKLTLASPVDPDSPGSISYKGTRPGGIENPIVSPDSPGSISGPVLSYAPGSIESPVDDPRRKEERRKRRDRRRRGLL